MKTHKQILIHASVLGIGLMLLEYAASAFNISLFNPPTIGSPFISALFGIYQGFFYFLLAILSPLSYVLPFYFVIFSFFSRILLFVIIFYIFYSFYSLAKKVHTKTNTSWLKITGMIVILNIGMFALIDFAYTASYKASIEKVVRDIDLHVTPLLLGTLNYENKVKNIISAEVPNHEYISYRVYKIPFSTPEKNILSDANTQAMHDGWHNLKYTDYYNQIFIDNDQQKVQEVLQESNLNAPVDLTYMKSTNEILQIFCFTDFNDLQTHSFVLQDILGKNKDQLTTYTEGLYYAVITFQLYE